MDYIYRLNVDQNKNERNTISYIYHLNSINFELAWLWNIGKKIILLRVQIQWLVPPKYIVVLLNKSNRLRDAEHVKTGLIGTSPEAKTCIFSISQVVNFVFDTSFSFYQYGRFII